MGKKPFSAKQKREQLRVKRAAALAAAHGKPVVEVPTSGAGPSRAGRGPKAHKKRSDSNSDPNRYILELESHRNETEEQRAERAELRALAHLPVVTDNAKLNVMDVHEVRPDGFAPVPRRPAWTYNDARHNIDEREKRYLEKWVNSIDEECYFERNLETWRQLWRVIERSDVLVLVVDIRFPALHFVPNLYEIVRDIPGKEMLLALNKCDMVNEEVRDAWKSYFENTFPSLRVAMFSSFPDARLAPCEANSELLSKRERRMAKSKLAAWGADLLADAIAELPVPEEKQEFLADWRNAVHKAHATGTEDGDAMDLDGDLQDILPRFAALRNLSPVSDEVTAVRDRPETNKERARAKKAQRRKRRRGKSDVGGGSVAEAISAAAAARDVADALSAAPDKFFASKLTPTPDSASIVSDDDWTKDAQREDMITIGMVGHPNTGKSSMINGIFRRKVVSTSKQPGHTKHLQTMFLTKHVRLCDCPGLVFPAKAPKELQVLAGMFPIAQVAEPYYIVKYIADRVDLPKVLGIDDASERAKLKVEKGIENEAGDEPWTAWTICEAWALKRGFRTARAARLDVYRAANSILRLALDGRIVLTTIPPGMADGNQVAEITEQKPVSMLDTDWNRRKMDEDEEGEDDEDEDGPAGGEYENSRKRKATAAGVRRNAFSLLDQDSCNVVDDNSDGRED